MLTEENSGHKLYGSDIAETSDGGYVLCGMSDGQFWIRKVNNLGNLND